MGNVNDTFFEGYYKEIWRTMIPEELTVREVDFIIPYFNLDNNSKVLDLMCGHGRHALALAKKGVAVTAVDNLADYIRTILEEADKDQLPLKAIQADIMSYKIQDNFDLAMCMGNSLNFFDAAGVVKLLSQVQAHLKPGGHLLINTWSIAEIAFKNFKEKTWSAVNGLKFLTDSRILFQPTRQETESTIITADGDMEVKTGIDYIFSLNEIEYMLKQSGFELRDVYSIPGKKRFTIGEPRAYIIAQKSV
jgi:SAM-dependent methyltransferase